MAISKAQARKVRLPVLEGDYAITGQLDATTTTEDILLSSPVPSVTFQSDGTLAGNVTFSVNGVDFASSTAFAANAMVTFSTHNVRVMRVTRTGGSGKLHVIAP